MDTSTSEEIKTISSPKRLSPDKRQHRSRELKRQIVEETLKAGASVARVARAHGVNANQVFAWRRQYQQGLLKDASRQGAGLWAVRVAQVGLDPGNTAMPHPASGVIQVELPRGQLRLTGCVDTGTLRVVLEALLR